MSESWYAKHPICGHAPGERTPSEIPGGRVTTYEQQPKHPRVMALVGVYPTEADARKHLPIAADLPYQGIWLLPEPTRARMHVFTTAPDRQLEADGMVREAAQGVTTYEEWRVTGIPRITQLRMIYRSEAEARALIERETTHDEWVDGPHLHKRTVTVTDWEEA